MHLRRINFYFSPLFVNVKKICGQSLNLFSGLLECLKSCPWKFDQFSCHGLMVMASGWGSEGWGLNLGTSCRLWLWVASKIHKKIIPSKDSKRLPWLILLDAQVKKMITYLCIWSLVFYVCLYSVCLFVTYISSLSFDAWKTLISVLHRRVIPC